MPAPWVTGLFVLEKLSEREYFYTFSPYRRSSDLGKTTGLFRYDLNQTPYDYTVEVRNRFKGLDLIDRVPDELWTEVHDFVQETGVKTIPKKKKCKKAKWLSSSKATQWVKAQHEGALSPSCISGNTHRFHTQLNKGPETP